MGDRVSETPLFRSGSSLKSLWQEYAIFADRLEFHTLLGTWSVPFSEIDAIEVAEARVPALLHGTMTLHALMAFKLDMADLAEHVTIDRHAGLARRVAFTPEDPTAFVREARGAMASWREHGAS
jgi:hypothetical protein